MSENPLQKEIAVEQSEKMTEEAKVPLTEQEKKRLKNQKKKQKQKQKKEQESTEKQEETKQESAPAAEKGKKKKGGKGGGNIAARLAAEQLKKKQEEEERIKKQIEEFERQEAERIRLIEEEEQRKKDIIAQKKADKKAKKEELIKQGLWKSKKQKQQEKIDEERRKLFEQAEEPSEEQQEPEQKKPKKKFVKPKEGLTEKEIQELLEKKEKERIEQLEKEEMKKEIQEEVKFIDFTKELLEEEQKANEKEDEDKIDKSPVEQVENCDLFDQKVKKSQKKQSHKQRLNEEKPTYAQVAVNPDQLDIPNLRSPIVCILGHVDTGKTTILDVIRRTNVQEGEAGGITQQIGATFFPQDKIKEELSKIQGFYPVSLEIPGLLIIDTPGHESFSNLRSRGSSLCDIAILVIDLMHGIEKQTLESIELLKMRKTPFVIALNKIDRLYEWKAQKNEPSFLSLELQKSNVQNEFRKRLQKVVTQLAENGFNSCLYYENDDIQHQVSLIPTSGITGEGMPDLFGVILKYTGKFLEKKITLRQNVFSCTVLEVKMIQGLGTTIDIILVDGIIREGDRIILMGFDGPIVTHIRALLTPHPMKEMRVKGEYLHHKVLGASMGIKISANDLESAVAGSQLYIVKDDNEIEKYSKELMKDLKNIKKQIKLTSQGICVAASTLGSLEAMLNYLKGAKIPVAYVRVGPVSKDDVIKALKPILMEDPNKQKKEFASVLAFDVKILPEAQEFADKNGISIFTGNIIYNLFDKYIAYVEKVKEDRKNEKRKEVVFPCIFKTVQFFNTKDPIILGVDIEKGQLRVDTPVCVYDQSKVVLGSVESIQVNHKPLQIARKENGSVAIKIKGDPAITAGRHFDLKSKFCSIISRDSLDILKEYFRDEMEKFDWDVARELKPFFQII